MPEINITKFFNNAIHREYSASNLELGNNAGKITWQNSMDAVAEYQHLNTTLLVQEFKQYAESFGAWDEMEINTWSDTECEALFIQMVSGDIREAFDNNACENNHKNVDWDDYEARCESGEQAGRLFKGIDGEVYYYIGS